MIAATDLQAEAVKETSTADATRTLAARQTSSEARDALLAMADVQAVF